MISEKNSSNIIRLIKKHNNLFNKYHVLKIISWGSYGVVFTGVELKNNNEVAIKIQSISDSIDLKDEAFRLIILKGIGIPKYYTFGKIDNYQILVEEKLGNSLSQIKFNKNNSLTIKDYCMIFIQIIQRLKFIHKKGIIHRDIKPQNFLFGNQLKSNNILHLIDFGLSKKIISSKTGKHIIFKYTGKLIGTLRYSSAYSMRGIEQTRRDDLIAAFYMIVYLIKGKLPWQNLKGKTEMETYMKIYAYKVNLSTKEFCKNLPEEFGFILEDLNKLKFSEKPNYEKYIRLLEQTIIKIGEVNNNIFSWNESIKLNKRSHSHTTIKKKLKRNVCSLSINDIKDSSITKYNFLNVKENDDNKSF